MSDGASFEKAWKITKELSLRERADAEEFAHPDDMKGQKLRDKVPSWMGSSKTGELNPRDLDRMRHTAASSPFRFFDEGEIYERLIENMSEDAYNRFELQSDSEEDMRRRVFDELTVFGGYSPDQIGECENCGAPAEGTGLYGGTQMSLCRGCA